MTRIDNHTYTYIHDSAETFYRKSVLEKKGTEII